MPRRITIEVEDFDKRSTCPFTSVLLEHQAYLTESREAIDEAGALLTTSVLGSCKESPCLPFRNLACELGIVDQLKSFYWEQARLACSYCLTMQNKEHEVQSVMNTLLGVSEEQVCTIGVFLHEKGDALAARAQDLLSEGYEYWWLDGEKIRLSNVHGVVLAQKVWILLGEHERGSLSSAAWKNLIRRSLEWGGGTLGLSIGETVASFSFAWNCDSCNESLSLLCPGNLSYEREGACPECYGVGAIVAIDLEKCIPFEERSLAQGAIVPWAKWNAAFHLGILERICQSAGIDFHASWSSLGVGAKEMICYGIGHSEFQGLEHDMKRRLEQALQSRQRRPKALASLWPYVSKSSCLACAGSRLGPLSRSLIINEVTLADIYSASFERLPTLFKKIGAPVDMIASLQLAQSAGVYGTLAQECLRDSYSTEVVKVVHVILAILQISISEVEKSVLGKLLLALDRCFKDNATLRIKHNCPESLDKALYFEPKQSVQEALLLLDTALSSGRKGFAYIGIANGD